MKNKIEIKLNFTQLSYFIIIQYAIHIIASNLFKHSYDIIYTYLFLEILLLSYYVYLAIEHYRKVDENTTKNYIDAYNKIQIALDVELKARDEQDKLISGLNERIQNLEELETENYLLKQKEISMNDALVLLIKTNKALEQNNTSVQTEVNKKDLEIANLKHLFNKNGNFEKQVINLKQQNSDLENKFNDMKEQKISAVRKASGLKSQIERMKKQYEQNEI